MDNNRSLPVRVSPDNHPSYAIMMARSVLLPRRDPRKYPVIIAVHLISLAGDRPGGGRGIYLQLQLHESELVSDNGHHTNGSKCYPKPPYTRLLRRFATSAASEDFFKYATFNVALINKLLILSQLIREQSDV